MYLPKPKFITASCAGVHHDMPFARSSDLTSHETSRVWLFNDAL